MKNLIDYFTLRTEEHKQFLTCFLCTLAFFFILSNIFYCLIYFKAL